MTIPANSGDGPSASASNATPQSSWSTFFGQFSWGIRIGILLGAIFYAACLVIALFLERWWLNVLLCMLGGVLGWFVGILGSPASRVQSTRFLEYRRALSAFVSGFVLARLDVLVSRTDFDKVGDPYLLLARVLLFAVTFVASVQFTFITRLTGSDGGPPEKAAACDHEPQPCRSI